VNTVVAVDLAVMGMPWTNRTSKPSHRNNVQDVSRYLDSKHGKNNYLVFNLRWAAAVASAVSLLRRVHHVPTVWICDCLSTLAAGDRITLRTTTSSMSRYDCRALWRISGPLLPSLCGRGGCYAGLEWPLRPAVFNGHTFSLALTL
jgi:hypothetical protein